MYGIHYENIKLLNKEKNKKMSHVKVCSSLQAHCV